VTTARVSVIMPVYRLPDSVEGNVARVVAALADVEGLEVVVVDDGSGDGTLEAAVRAASTHPGVVAVGLPTNSGKGHAIRAGVEASTGEVVVLLDGDLDLPPEQLPEILDRFEHEGVDVLVGAKHQSMRRGGYPAWRRFLSRAFSWITRIAFRLPVTETQTGLKVFRREPLDLLLPHLKVTRYAYDIELLVMTHRGGYRVGQVPVVMDRSDSQSAVRLGTLWEVARDTTAVWFRSLRRRRRQ
jgi:glycosyltransferase involved in cell wall biosynthesis